METKPDLEALKEALPRHPGHHADDTRDLEDLGADELPTEKVTSRGSR